MICNLMCFNGFQCPGGIWFDPDTGSCVSEASCSGGSSLPPGVAIGRPFSVGKTVPVTSVLVESASDWAGL